MGTIDLYRVRNCHMLGPGLLSKMVDTYGLFLEGEEKMKHAVLMILGLLMTPGLALADPATAKVPSDFTGKEVDVSYGEIDVKARELKLQAGAYTGKGDNKGAAVQVGYTDPHYIGTVGTKNEKGVASTEGLLLDPNLKSLAKFDTSKKEVQVVDVRALQVAAYRWQNSYFQGYQATEEELKTGKCAKPGHEIQASTTLCSQVKPNTTNELTLLPIQGAYRRDKILDVDQKGASIGLLTMSGHTAFKVNSLPMDVCGQIALGQALIGDNRLGKVEGPAQWRPVDASACLGIGMGKVGRLYNMANVQVDIAHADGKTAHLVRVTNAAGVERIGGTGLGANYSYSTATMDDGQSNTKVYNEHMVNLQYAF